MFLERFPFTLWYNMLPLVNDIIMNLFACMCGRICIRVSKSVKIGVCDCMCGRICIRVCKSVKPLVCVFMPSLVSYVYLADHFFVFPMNREHWIFRCK